MQEAHNVLARGQSNRRVFSTLANRASSRSHSIFTLKLVRTHRATGAERTSRFSIVDLAGSERVVNTQTTGDRLKEAGNINKSLMVLGQCMEVLRKNQEREKGRKVSVRFASFRFGGRRVRRSKTGSGLDPPRAAADLALAHRRCSPPSFPSAIANSPRCSRASSSAMAKP